MSSLLILHLLIFIATLNPKSIPNEPYPNPNPNPNSTLTPDPNPNPNSRILWLSCYAEALVTFIHIHIFIMRPVCINTIDAHSFLAFLDLSNPKPNLNPNSKPQ